MTHMKSFYRGTLVVIQVKSFDGGCIVFETMSVEPTVSKFSGFAHLPFSETDVLGHLEASVRPRMVPQSKETSIGCA